MQKTFCDKCKKEIDTRINEVRKISFIDNKADYENVVISKDLCLECYYKGSKILEDWFYKDTKEEESLPSIGDDWWNAEKELSPSLLRIKKMTKTEKLKKELAKLQLEVIKKKEELNSHIKEYSFIRCKECDKRTKIRNLPFIYHQWYVEPYSCTGGDYHRTDLENPYSICPECKTTIPLKELKPYEKIFKETLYEKNGVFTTKQRW